MKSAFGTLDPVLGAASAPFIHTGAVQRSAHNMVTNPRKVLHASSPDEDNTVLLQAVPFIRNISDYLISAREADLGHFTDCGIRLLGRPRHHLGAHATAKRVFTQGGGLTLGRHDGTGVSD